MSDGPEYAVLRLNDGNAILRLQMREPYRAYELIVPPIDPAIAEKLLRALREPAHEETLIAAAPALLLACRDVESKIVDWEEGRINWRPDDFLQRVRAAIAKAEGRS